MPLPMEKKCTANDYFAFTPEDNGERYELIDGEYVALAAPSVMHQRMIRELVFCINSYIKKNNGKCEVFDSPFDVRIDEYNVVQPDLLVICDPDKLDDKRCYGAPDLVIEVTSSNSTRDFSDKLILYRRAGVREYWIVDPDNETTLVYFFEKSDFPECYPFASTIPVGIYGGMLTVNISELIHN